jgi:hypothetical protein
VLNHALIDDPGVLSRIVEHYGDITDVTNQTRVVCEIARAMHGYEKVADFCKSLLHEQKFVDLYIERPEIAKALKKASKVDVASDPKLGEELANKFLSSRADLVGSNPETPILPLPRNVHELKEGKQVVVGNDGSVTLDGERFTWLEHVSARLQSHGGVRWFYEEYGELLNSDWVKTMQADGDLFATGAASAIAWPFAVAGEKLAALSVVIQDRSGKLIRFVGRGLLTVVLTTTVIAKGTRWLVQQAAEWIAIMGRKAYNKLVGYADAVWQWLSTPFVMALGAGGLPSVLATAGFVVLTGVLAGLCPVVGGSLAMTLGAPVLAGEIAGTVAGAGIIGTGAYTFVEAKELGRQLRCG